MSQNVNSSASSASEKKIGYSSEAELIKELQNYLTLDPNSRKKAVNYLYYSLVDDMILGVVLEVHHAWRLGLVDNEQQTENRGGISGENSSSYNVLEQNPPTNKKSAEYQCVCTICNRAVDTKKFTIHLEKCMGIHSNRHASRLANRRLVNREGTNYYGNHASDDDEISEKRKRKNNSNVRSNGKRNGKTS